MTVNPPTFSVYSDGGTQVMNRMNLDGFDSEILN